MTQEPPMFISIRENLKLTPNLLLITIPIWIVGLISAFLFVTEFTWVKLAYVAAGYFFFNILGITAGFHRYFCHKSFRVSLWKERLMMLAGTLAAQGPVIYWVALHRGYHHRHADKIEDVHSPIHGFWHSFVLWMFRLSPTAISLKTAVDLLRNKDAMFMSKYYRELVLGFWIVSLLIGIDFFLFAVMLPTFITIVTYNITNSVNHTSFLGYTNFETKDKSTNVIWLWPLVLGECWHNNHHARPGAYHLGSATSSKWWEFDPAGTFIKVFKNGER